MRRPLSRLASWPVIVTISSFLVISCSAGKDEEVALGAEQSRKVLPDAHALPGWEVSVEPLVYAGEKAKEIGVIRCYGYNQSSCDHVQFGGVSSFRASGTPQVDFFVMTYPDSATAKSAYKTVWKAWREEMMKPQPVDVSDLGDERDAIRSMSRSAKAGFETRLAQVRVGSVIMLTAAETGPTVKAEDALLADLATVFAKRVEQALGGDEPSAGSDGV